MIPRSYHCVLLALFSVFLLVPTAWGGGVWLYEGGTPDLGTAGAGRAALAVDASTVGANPAGMMRLDRF
jgi:long-chain fatty acid transport protein